jgi:hypothetical protein
MCLKERKKGKKKRQRNNNIRRPTHNRTLDRLQRHRQAFQFMVRYSLQQGTRRPQQDKKSVYALLRDTQSLLARGYVDGVGNVAFPTPVRINIFL